jgi:hypothetical protein
MKITYHNMWPNFANDNNLKAQMSRVLKPFESQSQYSEIQIYSLFPKKIPLKKSPNILTIQYSGESFCMDPTAFDLNFIPLASDYYSCHSNPTVRNTKIIPYLYATEKKDFLQSRYDYLQKSDSEIIKDKTKFCCFIASNSVKFRNDLFSFINSIKKVDSYGRLFNTGYKLSHGFWTKPYLEFLRPHKFMLACENTIMDWYCTEKPICALGGGTVPIYCGSDKLFNYINRESVIYVPNLQPETLQRVKQEIIELDSNDTLYLKKLRTPVLAKEDWDIDYINQIKTLFNIT